MDYSFKNILESDSYDDQKDVNKALNKTSTELYIPDKEVFRKSKEEKDLLKNLKKEFKKGNNKLED